jgi:ABC-2 type transport system permease protein
MTVQDDVMTPAASTPAAAGRPTRPFYWSVRRELWENHSIFIAPLVVAGLFLFGFLISAHSMPERAQIASLMSPEQRAARVAEPFGIVAMMLIVTGLVVSGVYCLGALYGERRDRSILFWKSLPVSNLTVVLTKITVPMVVLPVVVFAVTIATHLVVLLLSTLIWAANGLSVAPLWTLPFGQMELVLLYALFVLALWYAPVYGWLILASGWARRATFLWAVLPPIGLCIVEKIAFDSANLSDMFGRRLWGFAGGAFDFNAAGAASEPLRLLNPEKYFSSVELWLGLAVAAGLLAAAVWLRRRREPI